MQDDTESGHTKSEIFKNNRRQKMRSIFSILATVVLLMSVLTGCGTKSKTTGDDARITASPAVTDTDTTLRDDMNDDAHDAADDAGDAVGDVVGGAGDAVGDVVTGAGDAVDDAATGVGGAVEDMVDGVEDAAEGDDSHDRTDDQNKNNGSTNAGE